MVFMTDQPRTDPDDEDDVLGLMVIGQQLADAATPGPWRWAFPGSDQPVLMGTKGDENYSWEEEVLEAEHDHGCADCHNCGVAFYWKGLKFVNYEAVEADPEVDEIQLCECCARRAVAV